MTRPVSSSGIVVAIDAGTTGIRAIAVEHDGNLIDSSYQEFTQRFPRPGWVEHDAAEIWDVTKTVLVDLLSRQTREVVAIGITDQRETIVAWDTTTKLPLAPAIVWQDRRTAERCDELREAGHLDRIRSITGLVLDPYFSATKIEWLLNEGGVKVTESLAFGTIDSWLVWNLTGGDRHITDTTNAARTMLFDIKEMQWSTELCELFGVPVSTLPEVVPSAGVCGHTVASAGTPAGIPIAGIAGDQQSSLFGQACIEPGMAKNTYGTGSFVLMNIGTEFRDPQPGLLTTVAWTLPGTMLGESSDDLVTHYAFEGSIFVTGSAVQWLRDGLEIIESSSDIEPLAQEVTSSDGVIIVPAFTGLGSPYWDPYARGMIIGITRGTTKAHLARATIESMALQTRDVVIAMESGSGTELSELRVDGGAAAMDLLLTIQATQINAPVARTASAETTALGAAYLAGLGVGFWSSAKEVSEHWNASRIVNPEEDRTNANELYANWERAVERSRHWVQPA